MIKFLEEAKKQGLYVSIAVEKHFFEPLHPDEYWFQDGFVFVQRKKKWWSTGGNCSVQVHPLAIIDPSKIVAIGIVTEHSSYSPMDGMTNAAMPPDAGEFDEHGNRVKQWNPFKFASDAPR
jgi:hypothetical protein